MQRYRKPGAVLVTEEAGITYVFWSGGEMAKDAATAWAAENGGTTLEMTPIGRSLIESTAGMAREEAGPLWDAASKDFAEAASGTNEVHVFQSGFLRLGSTWARIEYPTLSSNGVNITYHFVAGG